MTKCHKMTQKSILLTLITLKNDKQPLIRSKIPKNQNGERHTNQPTDQPTEWLLGRVARDKNAKDASLSHRTCFLLICINLSYSWHHPLRPEIRSNWLIYIETESLKKTPTFSISKFCNFFTQSQFDDEVLSKNVYVGIFLTNKDMLTKFMQDN